MKQNDSNTQLKDKFKSAAAKRNHYQATTISQDSHKSHFLAQPQSQCFIDGKEETPDKYSEDAKTKELQARKAPRQQRDQTPLKGGQLGHSCDDGSVVVPKKIILDSCHEVWHLHFKKKCEMLERIQKKRGATKIQNPLYQKVREEPL